MALRPWLLSRQCEHRTGGGSWALCPGAFSGCKHLALHPCGGSGPPASATEGSQPGACAPGDRPPCLQALAPAEMMGLPPLPGCEWDDGPETGLWTDRRASGHIPSPPSRKQPLPYRVSSALLYPAVTPGENHPILCGGSRQQCGCSGPWLCAPHAGVPGLGVGPGQGAGSMPRMEL